MTKKIKKSSRKSRKLLVKYWLFCYDMNVHILIKEVLIGGNRFARALDFFTVSILLTQHYIAISLGLFSNWGKLM